MGTLLVPMTEGPPKWGHCVYWAELDASTSPRSIFGCLFMPPYSKIPVVPPQLGIPHLRVPCSPPGWGNKQHPASPPDPGRAEGHWGWPWGSPREEGGTHHGEVSSQPIAVQGNGSGFFPPGAPTVDVPGDLRGLHSR